MKRSCYSNPRHAHAGRGGIETLAADVIRLAIDDMRSDGSLSDRGDPGRFRHRSKAIIWLASNKASVWFDMIDLDQDYALENMGWREHASALLADSTAQLPASSRMVIQDGLDALGQAQEESI